MARSIIKGIEEGGGEAVLVRAPELLPAEVLAKM
jgi:hypothetical protein